MSRSKPQDPPPERAAEFRRLAAQPQPGVLRELVQFLLHNKKWWLVPIVLALLVLGFFIVVSGTGLAPYIYVIF